MKIRLPRGFEVARAASQLSNAKHARRIGAALYAGGSLLAIGNNQYGKSHPKAAFSHSNVHAEFHCLVKRQHYSCSNKNKRIIYVYRELANGSLACSRPCANCMYHMEKAGINKVYYINERKELECMKIVWNV